MDLYGELELDILSCLIQRPELMKEIKFEDKHIIKYKRLWLFMKSVYKRFGNFDLVLMTNASKNKYRVMDYVELLIDREPAPSRFSSYQDLLLRFYNEKKKERYLRERIYKLATDLYLGDIDLKKFKIKLDGAYHTADELYGGK